MRVLVTFSLYQHVSSVTVHGLTQDGHYLHSAMMFQINLMHGKYSATIYEAQKEETKTLILDHLHLLH